MTEDLGSGSTKEESQPKENLGKAAARAANFAVSRSSRAALINMGKAGVSQEELVENLPDYYHHVPVRKILDRSAVVPKDKTALVVTGYSEDFRNRPEEEESIEAFVRAEAAIRELHAGKFSVLVLSSSLPRKDIFSNSSFRWFNGPFQGEDSVWSIRCLPDAEAELVRHDLKTEIIRDPKPKRVRTWIDKQTFPLKDF